jgi:Xaa-Pro aminopeptidase
MKGHWARTTCYLCCCGIFWLCFSSLLAEGNFHDRRARLMAQYPTGLILVKARSEPITDSSNGYREKANFYYLAGLHSPDAVLVLDAPKKEAWLFTREKPASAKGIEKVAPVGELTSFVNGRLKQGVERLYHTEAAAPDDQFKSRFSQAEWASVHSTLQEMRSLKNQAEVKALKRTAWASTAALRAAMREVKPARTQRELESKAIASCVTSGAQGHSFWPRAMSGPHSVDPAASGAALDYHFFNRAMQPGELVSFEIGCSRDHYQGKVGRTVPVDGQFTDEQREVWNLLVAAVQAARSAIREGATATQVRTAYYDVFQNADVHSGLARQAVTSELQEAKSGGGSLLQGIGLDPMESIPGQLRSGNVVVLGAEIRLPENQLGFHIGDMLLVTSTGTELLTAGLPYSADEVETFLTTPGYAPYLIGDIHNHLDPLPRHGLENLISLMNIHGISKSIIFRGREKTSDYVLESVAKYPDRLIPFHRPDVYEVPEAWLANDPEVLAELERQLSSGRFRGVGEVNNIRYPLKKLGPTGGWGSMLLATEVSPLSPMMVSMFRLAEKHNLLVNIHNEVYYYKELMQLLKQFPKVTVLWSHGGGTDFYGLDMALTHHPNLYIDLSGRVYYDREASREDSVFYNEELVKTGWLEVIEKHPDRFLAGFDDNTVLYEGRAEAMKRIGLLLSQLTPATARQVALENMERLLDSIEQ